MRIDDNYPFEKLTLVSILKDRNPDLFAKVKELYEKVKDLLNTRIPSIFPNYTLHNTGHSFRIMEYMFKLVVDPHLLNDLEIAILVQSALLHDVGMAVSQEDVDSIKLDQFDLSTIKFSAMLKIKSTEDAALEEYVRRIHSKLSGKYVRTIFADLFSIPTLTSIDYTEELALICESHAENYDWIRTKLRVNEVRGEYRINPQYLACMLRIADILDIDSSRTPYMLYKAISPEGVCQTEWSQHYVISNTDKIEVNPKTGLRQVVFHGKCKNAAIHRKILEYIGWTESELDNAFTLLNGMPSPYSFPFEIKPIIIIQAEGYTFSNHKMKLDFKAITSLLMGEKIYGHKSLGLRELLQNAIDSCQIRKEIESIKRKFGQEEFVPQIRVVLGKNDGSVTISDNGLGMTLEIIKEHFLNVGSSYYNSQDFLLRDYNYKPIGNFGIGFLACFMLSDIVKIATRNYESKNKYVIDLERGIEYTSVTEVEDLTFQGTEIRLDYNQFMAVFNDKIEDVRGFLNKFFVTDGIDMQLIDYDNEIAHKIINTLIHPDVDGKRYTIIDIDDYLVDIEGYAIVKKNQPYIRLLTDIKFLGDVYVYKEDDGIIKLEDVEGYNIADFFSNNTLSYVRIPLVTRDVEDAFNSGMEFTGGDIDEVINKFENQLEWISILIPNDTDEYIIEDKIEQFDDIMANFNHKDLVELGHSKSYATKAYTQTVNLFEGIRNELYLPFSEAESSIHSWMYRENKKRALYVRNVLIKEFTHRMQSTASIFEIESIAINVKAKKILPDISRNKLSDSDEKMLNYSIGKAIHRGVADHIKLTVPEKNTLLDFISVNYMEITEFEKR